MKSSRMRRTIAPAPFPAGLAWTRFSTCNESAAGLSKNKTIRDSNSETIGFSFILRCFDCDPVELHIPRRFLNLSQLPARRRMSRRRSRCGPASRYLSQLPARRHHLPLRCVPPPPPRAPPWSPPPALRRLNARPPSLAGPPHTYSLPTIPCIPARLLQGGGG